MALFGEGFTEGGSRASPRGSPWAGVAAASSPDLESRPTAPLFPVGRPGGSTGVAEVPTGAFTTSAIPVARGRGSSGATASPVKHRGVQDIVAEEEASPNLCTHCMVPLITVVTLVVAFIAILLTSGGWTEAPSTPRAALIVVEGLRGDLFASFLQNHRLPNLQRYLEEQHGVYARCNSVADSRCACTVAVEDAATGTSTVVSGASMASILTGVSPHHHRVLSDSYRGYAPFAESTKRIPSLLARVRRAGQRTLALGAPRLMTSISMRDGQCSEYGVLDFECGVDALSQCLQPQSCNLNARHVNVGADSTSAVPTNVAMLTRFTHKLQEIFGVVHDSVGVARNPTREGLEATANFDYSLVMFHFNALARLASAPDLQQYQYSDQSTGYVAEAYLLDSQLGQLFAFLDDRAATQRENWLVIGTSNHGGSGKSFNTSGDGDSIVPYFQFTITSNTQRYTTMRPLKAPVTVMDVAPTVLTWLGIPPFASGDDGDDDAHNHSGGAISPFEGVVQGICSSGRHPRECDDDDDDDGEDD